jgi:hypothetical protein
MVEAISNRCNIRRFCPIAVSFYTIEEVPSKGEKLPVLLSFHEKYEKMGLKMALFNAFKSYEHEIMQRQLSCTDRPR